jgi:hypothetical protein
MPGARWRDPEAELPNGSAQVVTVCLALNQTPSHR